MRALAASSRNANNTSASGAAWELIAGSTPASAAGPTVPVDASTTMGVPPVPMDEITQAAADNPDVLIAFGSVDPHLGKQAVNELRVSIRRFVVDEGFDFFRRGWQARQIEIGAADECAAISFG